LRNKKNLSELSINQLSALTGSTYRTIVARLRDLPPKREDGRSKYYEPKVALPLIYEVGNLDDGKLDPAQERARKDKELADKTAMENAATRGEMLNADRVRIAVQHILGAVRLRLLAIPSKSAPYLLGLKEITQIQAKLTDEIHECLTELSTMRIEGTLPESEPADSAPPN
jgi:phage terminase Nu1 subunit (DNA packaging protein)